MQALELWKCSSCEDSDGQLRSTAREAAERAAAGGASQASPAKPESEEILEPQARGTACMSAWQIRQRAHDKIPFFFGFTPVRMRKARRGSWQSRPCAPSLFELRRMRRRRDLMPMHTRSGAVCF